MFYPQNRKKWVFPLKRAFARVLSKKLKCIYDRLRDLPTNIMPRNVRRHVRTLTHSAGVHAAIAHMSNYRERVRDLILHKLEFIPTAPP